VRYSKRHALRVKGEGPPEELRPYIEDRTSEAWEKRDPITVRGRITFLDFDGNWRPLVNASVNLYDDDTFGDDHLGTTATDWNGNWSFSVNNDDGFLQNGRDVYYTFHLGNTRWHVRDSDGDNYVWQSATHSNVSDGSVVDYGTETGSTNPESMQIFAVINLGWNHIVVAGGQDPGHVEIRFPESTTAWFPSQELVKVQMGYSDGPDVTLHEYGHALMQYAFGGERISPGGSHSFQDKEQDEGLAYSEGWATGYMLSVCPDGEFNWHEGADEDPGEWPTCTVQNDFGLEIELFRNTDNRKGEKNEGRVAAAMSDFRDFPNDDNGGNEDRGRNGESDQNVSNRISLATIYRDNMWGFVHEGFLNFWISLAGSLSGTTSDMAGDIMQYNWMSLPIEISCVASKIVTRDQRDQDGVLEGLRTFRDHALKPLGIGRQWMQTYYRHSPELAMILIGDEQARHAGLAIVRHFSEMGHTIRRQEAFGKLLERNPPLLPQKVQEAIAVVTTAIQKKGSKELKKELSEFHRVLSSFKRLSLVDAIRVGDQLKKRQQGRPLKVVNPASLSPASREVDWRVIRKNLSRSRIPADRNPDQKK
jgi:hypothetical protein